MSKNLWFLTEERPKIDVLGVILEKFAKDNKVGVFIDTLRIIPILKNGKFTFTYEVTGFRCNKVDRVYIKTVSGYASFVDYLIFFQEKEPAQGDSPIYVIEETKTDDSESRNTGVYQRASKFVVADMYYPSVKKIMLYSLRVHQKAKPTSTSIFGTRLLLTLGIEIIGKEFDNTVFTPFSSIDDVIELKGRMSKAKGTNVPISIKKVRDDIKLTGRLYKSGGLSHDPNIGALSLISAVLRKLGWVGKIEISLHGLDQSHVGVHNKFILIANKLNISLKGLRIPKSAQMPEYWKYDNSGEKLGTIFIHLVVENFTKGYSIFENHAGCEKGYFVTSNGDPIQLEKYKDRVKYKAGDKSQIAYIPDLVLLDVDRKVVVNVEGKKYKFRLSGIRELGNYDFIEKNYISKYYPKYKIIRTVVLFGSNEEVLVEVEVGFLLNEKGSMVLGIKAPPLFVEAVRNLIDFWKS